MFKKTKRAPSKRKRKRGQTPRIPQGEYTILAGDVGAPNLDAMEPGELHEFWLDNSKPKPQRQLAAQKMFPSRRSGYMAASSLLADYAINKSVACKLRLDGYVADALEYEETCERIYLRLPQWARW